MCSQQVQRDPSYADPTARVPFELWDQILQDLSPSQLTIVAQASKKFNHIVRNLSVWHLIWSTAKLADLGTSNEDYGGVYEHVLAVSNQICEGCYCYIDMSQTKHTFDRENTEELLRTSRFSDTGTLCNLCNNSRCDLWERKQQQLLQKRQQELEHYLQITLKAKRCDANLLPEQQLPYLYSGEQEDMQTTVNFIFRESVHSEFEVLLSRQARQSKLVSKLNLRGIQFRKSSQTFQSSNYVKYGKDISLDTATESIARSDWLRRNTEYEVIRLRTGRGNQPKSSDKLSPAIIKEEALKRYIRTRIQNGQWHHVREDLDTPARPPKSLWRLIEELSPAVCEDYALHCIFQCHHTLSRDVYPFEFEDIIESMNIGGWIITEKYSQPTSRSKLLICERMRLFLGFFPFFRLVENCRKKLLERKH